MDKQEPEKQPEEQTPKGRADHLKEYQFTPGVSGNPGGRPKGAVGLNKRIERKLLAAIKDSPDGSLIADALAAKIVQAMLKDPVKAERLIGKFMDRDEGPVRQEVELEATFTMEDLARRVMGAEDGE